jgi:hypothetical protein
VFDAAMLVALPDVGKEGMVAALIIYRVIYFMIPFAIALLIMAYWEATLFLENTRRGDAKKAIRPMEVAAPAEHSDRVD